MDKEIFIQEKRPHESGTKHVAGYAHYTDDISEPEGTLYGAIGYAKKSRAIIKKIDLKKVVESEGVVTVVTSKDILGRNDVGAVYDGDPIFPKKKVEYLLNVLPKRKELINLNRHNKNIKIDNYAIKPIFIIGVPRCGSTLIEKIIASGSQYIPIGEETGIIHTVVQNLINHKQSLNSDIDQFQTK